MDTNVKMDGLKDLGEIMAETTRKIMALQHDCEKLILLSKVAENADLSLLDENGKLWNIGECIGQEEYDKLLIFTRMSFRNRLEGCQKEFYRLIGQETEKNDETPVTEAAGKKQAISKGKEGGERHGTVPEKTASAGRKQPIDGDKVVRMYKDGATNKDIADKLGISRSRVSQILKMARNKGIL